MIHKARTKALSLLLSLAMVLSLLPGMSLTAHAETIPAEIGAVYKVYDVIPKDYYYYDAHSDFSSKLSEDAQIFALSTYDIDVHSSVFARKWGGNTRYLLFRPADATIRGQCTALKITSGDGSQGNPFVFTPQYAVGFNANGGSPNPETQYAWRGDTLTKPTDPTRDNATFDSWYYGNTKWDFDSSTVDRPMTLAARWKYNVTLAGGANATASGGATTQNAISGAMDPVTFTANSNCFFPATHDAYGTKNGVKVEVSQNQKTVTVSGTPTDNVSITIPDAHSHDFTYSAAGATITATCSADDCTLENGVAKLTISAPTTIEDGTVLTAEPEYAFDTLPTIYYSKTKSNGEWTDYGTDPFTEKGFYNAKITLGEGNNSATASVTYGISCIAYADDLEHGSVSGVSGAAVGATVTPTITPGTGYELNTLTVTPEEGSGVSSVTMTEDGTGFVMPEANVTVSATFKLIHSAITITQPTGGTVTASINDAYVTSADYDNIITLGNTPAEGYSFGSYTVTKTGESTTTVQVENGKFTMPAYPVTVTGAFTANDYTVTVSEMVNGTVQPNKTTAHINDEITLTVNPTTGYEIETLTVTTAGGDAVTVTDNKFTMPAAVVTVSATFKKISSAITIIQPTIGGSITVKNGDSIISTGTSTDYDDTITLSNTPATEFQFVSYKVTKTGDDNTTIDASSGSFSMPAYPVTVTATFEGPPFAVTTVSEPTIGGTVAITSATVDDNDVTKAKAGTEVTLTVTPAVGFEVDTVKYNNTTITASAGVYQFTMPTEAVTVNASFVGKPVTAALNVTGNGGSAALMELDNGEYKTITGSLTKNAGEKFILRVSTDTDYDYSVAFNPAQTGDLKDYIKEFSDEDYSNYLAYIKANSISVPSQTDLFWVTMPGVANGNLNIKVTFAKPKTFTVLYQPTDDSEEVWCKFTKPEGLDEAAYAVEMKKDAAVSDTAVWSVKVTAAFTPTKIAFATSTSGIESATLEPATVSQTVRWTGITGGEYLIIGGTAKTAIAAFVTDASALSDYDNETATFNAGKGSGATFQIAVCGTDGSGNVTNAGIVTAPAAPTKTGYTFGGWRGFLYDNNGKATEQTYNAGASVSVSKNTAFYADWKPINLSVSLDKNGGTGGTDESSVQYGQKLEIPENPVKSGFVFGGWAVQKAVTENGVFFAKGSIFDLNTPITADLALTAKWKHVHSYTCFQISDFGDALADYQSYAATHHIEVCGCMDVAMKAHSFDSNGKCACGYNKAPQSSEVTLEVSYQKWVNGSCAQTIDEMPTTKKRNQVVSVYALDIYGDYKFSKWEYSTDSGSTWHDLTADSFASFNIPCDTKLRAIYTNPTTVPQVVLSARRYLDHAEGYDWDNVAFHMDYKLPDGYTIVDAGVRLGDNAGISYYELKEIKRSAGEKAAWGAMNFGVGMISGGLGDAIIGAADAATSLESRYYYEKRENSVLDEMSAQTLADYMYQRKPVNVEKYPPIYWQSQSVTEGQSASVDVVAPLSFIQKNNGQHWIYGIAYLRYKEPDGTVKTIYTEALPTTRDNIPNYTVMADPNGKTNTKQN